jgi:FkbM family methyltransferase
MALTAPAFLMKHKYIRKRTRDLWVFWYQATRGRYLIAKRMGYRLLFDTENVVDKYLLAFGFYEDEQRTQLFREAAKAVEPGKTAVFIDIGAHWGVYSLWAYSTGLFTRVIAVEPDPRNVDQMHANLFLNDLSGKIEVVAAAASDVPGRVAFGLANFRGRVGSKMAHLEHAADYRIVEVTATRVDDLLADTDAVLVIKIDVEGFEVQVIAGMRRLLNENKALLQVEAHDVAVDQCDQTMSDLGYSRFLSIGPDRYYKNF